MRDARYQSGEKGIARSLRYDQSEKGLARKRRYDQSEKGRARTLLHASTRMKLRIGGLNVGG